VGESGEESLELIGVLSTESGIKLSEVLEKLDTLFKYSGIDEYEVRVDAELMSDIDA
jgi:hypothetical protein